MQRLFLFVLFLISIPQSFSHAAELRDGNGDWLRDSGSQMVFHAVLEGLFNDGVSQEHAALMFPSEEKFSEHFVYSCPLCHPAVEALRIYKTHPHFEFDKPIKWVDGRTPAYQDSFGKGLDAETIKRLESTDRSERTAVIQELIQRWVSRKLNSMRLTVDERQKWKTHLDALRERGMASLEHIKQFEPANAALQARKACPACDGSAAACAIVAGPEVVNNPVQLRRGLVQPDVFFAVLEELYRSGASNEDLAAFLPTEPQQKLKSYMKHFVYSCSLCHSTWEAMRLYSLRPAFHARKDAATTFGKGLDPAISVLLRSDDHQKRMQGVQTLVTVSLKNRMDRLRLTVQDKTVWSEFLKKLREQGTQMLASFQKEPSRGYDYTGWKYCPSCDGSTAACKLDAKPKMPAMGPEF